jgi:thiopurine S-methyltransferase
VTELWLERWEEGRTGWHEPDGNFKLKAHWPMLATGTRVLVPLCGKSPDLLWLAQQNMEVVGIELSSIAVEAFFSENDLGFGIQGTGHLRCYRADALPISIYCGDYFDFDSDPFGALYDRAALIAMPPDERPGYVQHTKALLTDDAYRMVIALEYDQAAADGPPYSVLPEEILSYWDDLRVASQHNDIDNSPPKFREAGLTEVIEKAWISP